MPRKRFLLMTHRPQNVYVSPGQPNSFKNHKWLLFFQCITSYAFNLWNKSSPQNVLSHFIPTA